VVYILLVGAAYFAFDQQLLVLLAGWWFRRQFFLERPPQPGVLITGQVQQQGQVAGAVAQPAAEAANSGAGRKKK
jgi:hypothetical protein